MQKVGTKTSLQASEPQSSESGGLLGLPEDLFREVLRPLGLLDQARLRRVCRRMRATVDELSGSALARREVERIERTVQLAQHRRARRPWGLHDAVVRRAPLWAAALRRTGLASAPPWGSRHLVAIMDALAAHPAALTRTTHLTLAGISPRGVARLDLPSSRQWLDAAVDLLEHRAAGLEALHLQFKRSFRSVLPGALGRLPALAELEIQGAGLCRLPLSLAMPSAPRLRRLSLVDTSLGDENLAMVLAHQVHLRSLTLSVGSRRTGLDGARLASAIRGLGRLEELILDELPGHPETGGIAEHPTLRRMTVGFYWSPEGDRLAVWTPDATRELILESGLGAYPDSLSALTALTHLTLASNHSIATLPPGLSRLERLEGLILSNLSQVVDLDEPRTLEALPRLRRLTVSGLPRLEWFPWGMLLDRALGHVTLEDLPCALLPSRPWSAEHVTLLGDVWVQASSDDDDARP